MQEENMCPLLIHLCCLFIITPDEPQGKAVGVVDYPRPVAHPQGGRERVRPDCDTDTVHKLHGHFTVNLARTPQSVWQSLGQIPFFEGLQKSYHSWYVGSLAPRVPSGVASLQRIKHRLGAYDIIAHDRAISEASNIRTLQRFGCQQRPKIQVQSFDFGEQCGNDAHTLWTVCCLAGAAVLGRSR